LFEKIIKTVATRSQLLKLKCTKFDFGWGCAQTPLGKLTRLPYTFMLDFRGSYLQGKERKGKRGGQGKRGNG